MGSTSSIRALLEAALSEPSTDVAMQLIVESARDATDSRNALIAILDVEAGHLEISYGSGPDWTDDREGVLLKVAIGRREGITAYVAATGKSFVSRDVAESTTYHQLFESTKSEMATPIRDAHGRLVAVLNLESDQLNHFSDEHVTIAETIAAIAATTLERDQSRAREEALVETSKALNDALSEDEALDQVIDVASRVLRFQACSIFIFDARSQTFVLRASTGAFRSRVGEFNYSPGEGFTGWVCESGQPIMLDHPQGDPRWRGKYTEIPSDEIACFLAAPILVRGKSMGAIRALRRIADNEYLDNRFNQDDLRMLVAIAELTGVAIDNLNSINRLVGAERMAAWGELSAKSSHMIGNRVFALRGDVNELEYQIGREPIDLAELKALQKGLETNVTRIQELLQDFRDFVSATQLNRSVSDLNALVRETLEEVFPKRGGVTLELDLADDLPPVSFDAKKLRLALSELVENSFNFFDSGTLKVATRKATAAAARRAQVGAATRFVEISVADSGPGVAPDLKEQIFQPFFSTRVKGMGLGLSIVRGIAEAHGGAAIEMGESGSGAIFAILLPISERQKTEGA